MLLDCQLSQVGFGGEPYSNSTALHAVASKNNVGLARVLLKESRIDVNRSSIYGDTALYVAAGAGSVEVMQLLLDASIHIEQRDICNRTAIYWAAELEKMGGQFTQELQCIRWRVIGMSSNFYGFIYALFEVLQ